MCSGIVAMLSSPSRQSSQNARQSRASGVTTALRISTGPWAITVWTARVSSWTPLRIRPEVDSVNHDSGARARRCAMPRCNWSRNLRSATWVMSRPTKYSSSWPEKAPISSPITAHARSASTAVPALWAASRRSPSWTRAR